MQLTPLTVQILKSYIKINPSIEIRPGKVVATLSQGKTVYARAEVDQEFDNRFAIHDLSKFLSVVSLLGADAEYDITDKKITIKNDTRQVTYALADAGLLTVPPEKDPKMPAIDAEFTVSESQLKELLDARAVLVLPEIAVVGDGKKLSLQAIKTDDPTTNVYSVEVGKTDKKFRAVIKEENLKILQDGYDVSISSKGLSRWKGGRVEYFIALDKSSTF